MLLLLYFNIRLSPKAFDEFLSQGQPSTLKTYTQKVDEGVQEMEVEEEEEVVEE